MSSAVPAEAPGGIAAVGSLRNAQIRTIVLLFIGYAACYYCRADLSVATPLLADELGRRGLNHGDALVRLGAITSFGVAAYAIGKLFLTGLADYWGGRRNFLIGVGGAAVFTLLFGLSGALATVHARLGRKSAYAVGRLGGTGQGVVEVVRLLLLWFDSRDSQHQLSDR